MSKLSINIYDRRDNVKSLQQLFTVFTQLVTRCPPGDSQAGLLIPLTSKQTRIKFSLLSEKAQICNLAQIRMLTQRHVL